MSRPRRRRSRGCARACGRGAAERRRRRTAAAGPTDRRDNGQGAEGRGRVWARFLAASLVIVISMAAATSISILLYLTDIAKGLSHNEKFASLQSQLATSTAATRRRS